MENPLNLFTCRQVKISKSANSETESDVENYFALFQSLTLFSYLLNIFCKSYR